MRTFAAIHQPTFLPWLGFFDKVARSSKFVFFDAVQFPRGKSWCSRVQILLEGRPAWLTMPVEKTGNARAKIYEVRMIRPEQRWGKILTTLRHAYAKAPHYPEVAEFLELCTPRDEETLAHFNASFVERVSRRLGFDIVTFVRASANPALRASEARGTDAIIETCHAFGIDRYLSGDGTEGFLEPELFAPAAIELRFQEFVQPVYPQIGTDRFIGGLSVVDALMNCGWAGVRALLVPPPQSGAEDVHGPTGG